MPASSRKQAMVALRASFSISFVSSEGIPPEELLSGSAS
jgi:hypothetical protein